MLLNKYQNHSTLQEMHRNKHADKNTRFFLIFASEVFNNC